MKTKSLFLVLLASVVLLTFALAASPAVASSGGLTQVGTPDVAHVFPTGKWWSSGNGWGAYTEYAAGTLIPAQDYVTVYSSWADLDKSLMEGLPQFMLFSLTVKAGNDVVVELPEEQSAQFWGTVA